MGVLKWIGGGLGFALSGPIGALIGLAIASIIEHSAADQGTTFKQRRNFSSQGKRENTVHGDFSVSLLVLIAAVMKADGKVLKTELDYVKKALERILGKVAVPQALHLLRDLLKKDIPLREVCQQITANMQYAYRLELLHLLFGVSKADGAIHASELSVIEQIAYYLDISRDDMTSIKAMFIKSSGGAYKILEIPHTATDAEVKKAYRQMAVKYHPDKVAHLGEELQAQANEKFRKVQQAYEEIKAQRGI